MKPFNYFKAGAVVLAYKSKFLDQAIKKAQANQAENKRGQPIELDFKSFPQKTVKVIKYK